MPVLLALILAAGVALAVVYNRLVVLRNRVGNALAQIDVQLRRRHDLVPGLVESARAFLVHERSVLDEVARLRAAAAPSLDRQGPGQPAAGLVEGDLALSGAVGRLVAVAESYPGLRADGTMARLMEDLTSVENRVGFARQAYNDAAMRYNLARESFPALLFASLLGFGEARLWWAAPGDRAGQRRGGQKL
ncbi:MAG: LemA family protein [Deltaproteobacteria bacterium]|nr:LemA family protein [Deltaproteobacteria bacterium]